MGPSFADSGILRLSALALGLLALGAGAGSAAAQQKLSFHPERTYRVDPAGGPAQGPRDALVTIVEFSDFNCPACRRAFGVLRRVLRLYPEEVRLVYRHHLLDPRDGTLAAEASMAAAEQGRFWAFHDRAFAGGESLDRSTLERYAREIGLDLGRFRDALDTRRHLEAVRADDRSASRLGLHGTPMFFVNGRPISGAQPLSVFVRVIEEELAQARRLVASGVKPSAIYEAVVGEGARRGEVLPPGADVPAYPRLHPLRSYPVGLGRRSHRRGPDDALVTIVEFSDFDCGYCKKSRATLERLGEEFGGDVRFAFRHFALGGPGDSKLVAEAAVAAGAQGSFWAFHDRAYAAEDRLERADLFAIARSLGLDMERFRAALEERRYFRAVTADTAEGRVLGVRGTPTFFINGTPVEGALPYEQLRAVVRGKLFEARALVASGADRTEVYEKVSAPGDRAGPPVPDETDHHIAAVLACAAAEREKALEHLEHLEDEARRADVAAACEDAGVELPEAGR